jgi:hypothetical protein
MNIDLYRGNINTNKKFVAIVQSRKVRFGQKGYEDYTIHKDPKRLQNYLSRHASRENWTKSGVNTAGFWSRWILWNKPTLMASIADTQKILGVKITFHKGKTL